MTATPLIEHPSPFNGQVNFAEINDFADRPAQPKLVTHRNDFAIPEMDFEELRTARRVSVFVLQLGDDFS